MKTIDTLVDDIYTTIKNKKDGWFTEELSISLGQNVAGTLRSQLGDERPAPYLRLSQMGNKCPRALWYSIHHPELAEPLPAWAEIKYSYGHMIEALAITLAKASGHEVTGEQDELVLLGIKGHRDCIIDGHIVDVKSTSSFGFAKFKDGSLAQNDPFGYLEQLDGYMLASIDDDRVRHKDVGYILAVDKTLGHMVLYRHKLRRDHIIERINSYKNIVALPAAPSCTCGQVPHQKSGNMMLDMKASYNPYKHCCFPSLRTFIYSSGPVYLTKVVKKPDVLEIDKHGRHVYH